MEKILDSNKPFEGKKKARWNKDISKKKTQRNISSKEVLNSYNIGKPWFDHEE